MNQDMDKYLRHEIELTFLSLKMVLDSEPIAELISGQIVEKAKQELDPIRYFSAHAKVCVDLALMGVSVSDLMYCDGFFPPVLRYVMASYVEREKIDYVAISALAVEAEPVVIRGTQPKAKFKAGHNSARNRVIQKEAYTTKRK